MPTDKIIETIANILVDNPEIAGLINSKMNDVTARAKQAEMEKAKKIEEIDDKLKALEENRVAIVKEIDHLKTVSASINGKIGNLIKLRKNIVAGNEPAKNDNPVSMADLGKILSDILNTAVI